MSSLNFAFKALHRASLQAVLGYMLESRRSDPVVHLVAKIGHVYIWFQCKLCAYWYRSHDWHSSVYAHEERVFAADAHDDCRRCGKTRADI